MNEMTLAEALDQIIDLHEGIENMVHGGYASYQTTRDCEALAFAITILSAIAN